MILAGVNKKKKKMRITNMMPSDNKHFLVVFDYFKSKMITGVGRARRTWQDRGEKLRKKSIQGV